MQKQARKSSENTQVGLKKFGPGKLGSKKFGPGKLGSKKFGPKNDY